MHEPRREDREKTTCMRRNVPDGSIVRVNVIAQWRDRDPNDEDKATTMTTMDRNNDVGRTWKIENPRSVRQGITAKCAQCICTYPRLALTLIARQLIAKRPSVFLVNPRFQKVRVTSSVNSRSISPLTYMHRCHTAPSYIPHNYFIYLLVPQTLPLMKFSLL